MPFELRGRKRGVSNPVRTLAAAGALLAVVLAAPSTPGAMAPMTPEETSLTPGGYVYGVSRDRPSAPKDGPKAWPWACSLRHRACVHAEPALAPAVMPALASLDRSWEVLTGAMDLPEPDADPATGAYDLYLLDEPGLAETALSARTQPSFYDRASAYSLVDGRLDGCMRDLEIARQLARAIGARMAPSTDEGSARGGAGYLARLAVPCAIGMIDGVDVAQAHSERTLVATMPLEAPRFVRPVADGSALFWWWLDDAFGRIPGGMVAATWALTATRTPAGENRWAGEPDGWDVLRHTFKGALTTGSTLDDLLVDFAVARAQAGDLADDQHFVESTTLGAAARVAIDWDIPWPAAPRRLASPRALGPMGASYVRVSRAGAPPGSRLRVELEWENHARMRWVAVRLGPDGRERSRVLVGSHDRTTEANLSLAELDAADAVLLVGVNCGDWKPFDPDDRDWQPHGWLLTVAQE